jgi:hypothetical protein
MARRRSSTVTVAKHPNPPGLYVVYVRDNIALPAEFCSTRKAWLHEQAQQAKNADRARRARLDIDYDEYQAAEIRRYIGETMPREEYQRMSTSGRNASNTPNFGGRTAAANLSDEQERAIVNRTGTLEFDHRAALESLPEIDPAL